METWGYGLAASLHLVYPLLRFLELKLVDRETIYCKLHQDKSYNNIYSMTSIFRFSVLSYRLLVLVLGWERISKEDQVYDSTRNSAFSLNLLYQENASEMITSTLLFVWSARGDSIRQGYHLRLCPCPVRRSLSCVHPLVPYHTLHTWISRLLFRIPLKCRLPIGALNVKPTQFGSHVRLHTPFISLGEKSRFSLLPHPTWL